MCAKGRAAGKPLLELDAVAKALRAKGIENLRSEAVARGQTGYLAIAARELSGVEKTGPTGRIRFQLNRDSHSHAATAARRDFGEWLDGVCQAVLPKQLLWLAENLCEVNSDFAWVKREIEKSLTNAQTEILSCAGSVSTGRPGEIASWLIDWPEETSPDVIFSAVSSGPLDSACAAKVRTAIGNYVEEAFAKAGKSATGHALILIARKRNPVGRETDESPEVGASGSMSRPVERGKFCDQVIDEIKKIKNWACSTGRSVAEIETEHPNFAVWKVRRTLGPEDQETFNHPNQWGAPVGYAKMVLSKAQGVAEDTITSSVKAYRRHQKTKKGPPR